MSWRNPAWDVLGVEPTTDQSAIRRAYAARLKTIDADRDPAAFIKLREAFEQARNEATWADLDEDDAQEPLEPVALAAEATLAARPPERTPPPPEPEPAPSPWAPPRPEDFDARAAALLQLLDREGADIWATPDEAEAMLAHWRALATDPRLDQIGRFAEAEQWFAHLVARNSPFSDPLVGPVSDFFGWMAAAGDISQSPAVAFVAQRRRLLDFAAAVDQPGHPLHRAWIELTTPATERSRRGRVPGRDIEKLIETVRRDVPGLEANFDGYRVSLWTKKKDRSWVGMLGWWIFIVVVIQFANLTKCIDDRWPPPPPPHAPTFIPAKLENTRADTDRALEILFAGKLDVATAAARNPHFAAAMNRQWQADLDAGATLPDYVASLQRLINQRYRDGIANAPADLLRERQRYELARAELARNFGAKICAAHLSGTTTGSDMPLPPALEQQRQALVARMVLETRPTAKPRPKQTRFAVPAEVLAAAAKRAGLSTEALARAMRFEGPEQAQCDGRIAFIQTVLALPAKRAAPLLRAM